MIHSILLYYFVIGTTVLGAIANGGQRVLVENTKIAKEPEITPAIELPLYSKKTSPKRKHRHTSKVKDPDALVCQDDIGTDYNYCTEPGISPITTGYTVSRTPCPNLATYVRPATGIGSSEASWLSTRSFSASIAFRSYTSRAWGSSPQYNLPMPTGVPRIGIALSGGGYRAMLNGAGVIQSFTGSDPNANGNGTGGILDSSLYITGLSGGSWTIGSWALNNWPDMNTLVSSTTSIKRL
jgi:hypothetical protein